MLTRIERSFGVSMKPLLTIFFLLLLVVTLFMITPGKDTPPLQIWHTEKLSAEFNADMAKEVKTFEEYRELEDTLFHLLEEKIYAQTGTGPQFTLIRYSSGSSASPFKEKTNWNRSFELATGKPEGGVLLLHGMSDSPYSLRAIGMALHKQNFWVVGLRLPGHGTIPSGLKYISVDDMTAAVKLGMNHLSAKVGKKPIHIVGYSTGATLALDYALDAVDGMAQHEPASLVLISPAIGIHPAAVLASVKNWLSIIPGLGRLAWLDIMPEFDPYKYNSFATNAANVVYRLTQSVSKRIATHTELKEKRDFPPMLVFKSTVDATVSIDAVADKLLKRFSSTSNELVLFDINRLALKSTFLVSDPGPLTDRLMKDEKLPFAVSLITNENLESSWVEARYKPPFSSKTSSEPLNLTWPLGVISLSHIALPFAPNDPLYGIHPPERTKAVYLGQMNIKGERGLLLFPADWLLRLRHNPFYAYLEKRTIDWFH